MASQHASTSSQTARSSSKRKLEVSVADSSVAGPVLGELPPFSYLLPTSALLRPKADANALLSL